MLNNFMFFLKDMCTFECEKGIDETFVNAVSIVYKGILIGVPIILILVGMIDLGKAITQQKEEDIKKAQSLLIKKAIAALLVFVMLPLTKTILGLFDSNANFACASCVLLKESLDPNSEEYKQIQEKRSQNGETPTNPITNCGDYNVDVCASKGCSVATKDDGSKICVSK